MAQIVLYSKKTIISQVRRPRSGFLLVWSSVHPEENPPKVQGPPRQSYTDCGIILWDEWRRSARNLRIIRNQKIRQNIKKINMNININKLNNRLIGMA
jgi:hypothetical protein